MFSNELDPRIDSWFSGNIIVEQKITRSGDSCRELSKLIDMVTELPFENFQYVTHVINYKSDNLLFLKISDSYPLICSLSSESDYIFLEKIHNAFTAWLERTNQLGEFMNIEDLLIHRLDLLNLSNNEIYNKEREVFDSLMDNDDDLRELLTNLFYERLTI